MNLLVVGRTGQLAVELLRASWPDGTRITALGRGQLDITDREEIRSAIARVEPEVVINASAYTAVDRAESESDLAFAVNRTGPQHLAEETASRAIPLIHVSTDYVFSGPSQRPWREDDQPRPTSVYGRSKYLGERAIEGAGGQHVILRTSWLFAAHGQNFVRTMLRLGGERDSLGIVNDQRGCPTAASDLARVITEITAALSAGSAHSGLYHYAGSAPVTWYEFAEAIFARAGDLVPRPPVLKPISTAEFRAPAPRPEYSVLDSGKIDRDFGISATPWLDGLQTVLDTLRSAPAPQTTVANAGQR